MNIMKKIALLSLTLIFGLAAAFSQSAAHGNVDQAFLNDFVRRKFTTADGLPGMTITDIMQDTKGYIYIGTYDGLVRFDGVEFVTFNRNYDKKYDFTAVRSIYQDTNGNIWIGHNDEGVSCISRDGQIKKYTVETDGLPHNSIRAICEDNEKNIWLGTASGLCYMTPEERIVIPNGLQDLGQTTIQVSKLYCDTAGRIWISTAVPNELFVYSDKRIERFDGITKIKNPAVNEVTQDKTGALWFGVAPHYAVKIKDTEETLFDIGHDHTTGTVINSAIQDANGDYWFAGDSGITIIHNGMYTYYDKRNGVSDDYINKIMQDREGNIWIAYNRGGVEKMSQGKFRTITMHTAVNAICEDKGRGGVWLGADDGVYFYKDNKFVENEITRKCKGNRIREVRVTSDGELLISCYSKLSSLRVMPDGRIFNLTERDGLAGYKCRAAVKLFNGDYYIGTTQGLSIVDRDTGSISNITRENGLANEFIMAIYEDKKGRVWVGTDGGGVYVLEDRQIVRHYNTESGLSGNVIFKFTELNDDEFWITTGTGISKYIEASDSFQNLNSASGLMTDGVFQILADYTQTVWMTSNRGIISAPLAELDEVGAGKKERINTTSYSASDGLVTGGVTATSFSMKDSAGRLWFTLIDGFAIYDPVKSGKNMIAPKVEIQEYSIDNNTFDYTGKKIVLAPSTKRFSVKFTGLSFISSEQIKFRYKLNGFEKDYTEWSALRTASYTNLKPGTYAFTVQTQNGDEIKSEPSDPIVIVKQPYIWQLAWFWVAIGLVIVGIVALVIWLKWRAMKRYQVTLEKEVAERTRDLKIANEKAEKLLLNILPQEVAAELTEHPDRTIAKKFPNATVLFTDIVGFTKMSGGMSADEVVGMLNAMITKFDERAKREGIEKIKTIGDAYMAATGLTEEADNGGALKMVKFAQGLIRDVVEFNATSPVQVQIRLGINTGNLVAGVIGKSKFIYDIWGDTVNVASRMESTGKPMAIHVSEATYEQTQAAVYYGASEDVEVKGKGLMKTYFAE